uniref:Uncharacterized protein n=1 Tax=Dromaius novaehollandiae TaxID=8790 RepID=A0A8C4K3M1_DRONO
MSKIVNGVRIPTKRIVTNGRERIETHDKVLRWKNPQCRQVF